MGARTSTMADFDGFNRYDNNKWERKAEYPMLPIGFFKFNGFSLGLIAIMLASFVMFSFMFTQMLHFQLVRGHTALEAAVRFLPLPLGLMPAAANSDRLSAKFGSNNVISMGLVLMTAAMAIFTTVEIDSEYIRLACIFLLLGFGMGLTLAPATTVVMDSIPSSLPRFNSRIYSFLGWATVRPFLSITKGYPVVPTLTWVILFDSTLN